MTETATEVKEEQRKRRQDVEVHLAGGERHQSTPYPFDGASSRGAGGEAG